MSCGFVCVCVHACVFLGGGARILKSVHAGVLARPIFVWLYIRKSICLSKDHSFTYAALPGRRWCW
jgi:hypothetical protein